MSGKADYKKSKDLVNENEISNGYKKSKKKSVSKSDHKHDYEDVILKWEDSSMYTTGGMCKICGRIKEGEMLFTKERNANNMRYVRLMDFNEIKEVYPDIKLITYNYVKKEVVKVETIKGGQIV